MTMPVENCPACGAPVPLTSKKRSRFLRRHPERCMDHARIKALANAPTVRSIDARDEEDDA